jgi:hypothetical protein
MGALGDAIKADGAVDRRMRCRMAQVLEALDDDDAADLRVAFDDADVTHASIARVLTAAGHSVTQNLVTRHRNGLCSCGTR